MDDLAADLLDEIRRPGLPPRRRAELADALNLPKKHRRPLDEALEQLLDDGAIRLLDNGRYVPTRLGTLEGRLDVTRQGYAFVATADASELDVRIEGDDFAGALPGDRVRVEVYPAGERARYLRGRVVEVVERARERFVALVHADGRLHPEDIRNPYVFRLVDPPGDDAPTASKTSSRTSARRTATPASMNARPARAPRPPVDTKVLAQIAVWPGTSAAPAAYIVDILGPAGRPDTETAAILARYDAPGPFPEAVREEAASASARLDDADFAERLDLTDALVCTIDPDDARDFDDALHVEVHDDGSLTVGVHIADVARYVRPGTALDAEARERATSIYLPGRVIPMLPEELSNDVCSLRAGEDRPVKTVLLRFDANGKRRAYSLHRAVIRSRQRLAYGAVLALLENRADPEEGRPPVLPELHDPLRRLNALAQQLRAARKAGGAIELSKPEYRIVLGDDGRAVGVEEETTDSSHQLVEEFMLAANVAVAEWATTNRVGILHRVHPPPPPRAAEELALFLTASGYPFKPPMSRKKLQAVLDRSMGRPEQASIHMAVLRAFSPAAYSPDGSQGHFALNFPHYTHFTSPIRRYPDLWLHQAMDAAFTDGADRLPKTLRAVPPYDPAALAALGIHTSERERRAMKIEGDVVDFRRLELLQSSGRSDWTATVTGIRRFGVFVQLDGCFVEGLLPRMALTRRGYEAREEPPPHRAMREVKDTTSRGDGKSSVAERAPVYERRARGGRRDAPRGGRRGGGMTPGFYLGQRVRVRVLSVDLPSRECTLDFLGTEGD